MKQLGSWRKIPIAYWGMIFAHMGVAVATLGVAISKGYGIEADLRMTPGSEKKIGSYIFKMVETKDIQGPNYQAVDATFSIHNEAHKLVANLHPEKRIYEVDKMAMTDSDIDVEIFRDLYIALAFTRRCLVSTYLYQTLHSLDLGWWLFNLIWRYACHV